VNASCHVIGLTDLAGRKVAVSQVVKYLVENRAELYGGVLLHPTTAVPQNFVRNTRQKEIKMKPKTLEELFDQIEIDANNGIVYNKRMYLNFAKDIFAEHSVQQSSSGSEPKGSTPKSCPQCGCEEYNTSCKLENLCPICGYDF
jgi:hypothetical protein